MVAVPVNCFQTKLEFGNVGFWGGRKTGGQRKILRARTRTNNKINLQVMPGPGMEPRPQWWEANVLITVPSSLPCFVFDCFSHLSDCRDPQSGKAIES